jgi:DUF1707 SHOCT-like domain
MASNPDIRASDIDRDRVAEALREHSVAGRISMDELNERLDATYTARTLGDLQVVTADLPEHDAYQLPVPAAVRSSPAPAIRRPHDVYRKGVRLAWASWASVNLVCFVIWLLTTLGTVMSGEGLGYPWFLWVAGPWGAVILAGQIFGPRHRE